MEPITPQLRKYDSYHDSKSRPGRDEFVAIELRPDLTVALANLPEEFRSAVALSDIEGLPLEEVAVVLDIPIGTVKSRVFRGRKLLAKSRCFRSADPHTLLSEPLAESWKLNSTSIHSSRSGYR